MEPNRNLILLLRAHDELIALGADDGRRLWSREVAGATAVLRLAPGLWAVPEKAQIIAFDEKGTPAWRWNPGRPGVKVRVQQIRPVAGRGLLVVTSQAQSNGKSAHRQWYLSLLATTSGQLLWQTALQASPALVVARPDRLVLTAAQQMVWLDPASGRILGGESLKHLEKGPWTVGGLILAELHGHWLKRLAPDPAKRWMTSLPGAAVGDPVMAGGSLLVGVQDAPTDQIVALSPEDGSQQQVTPVPGRLAGQLRPHLAMAVVGKDRLSVLRLGPDGSIAERYRFKGEPAKVFDYDGKTLLFLIRSVPEVKLDPAGQVVYDLIRGTPERRFVGSFRLVSLGPGRPPRILDGAARSGLVGPIQLVGHTLVYATQLTPARRRGVPVQVDPRFPYQPVVIRGYNLADQTSWRYAPTVKRERPSQNRMGGSRWDVFAGKLFFTTAGEHLVALDVDDGRLAWKSTTALSLDQSSPVMRSAGPGRLLIVAQSGQVVRAYGVDTRSGSVRWSYVLTPFFIWKKLNHLIGVLIICLALGYFIYAARRRKLFLRRIAGLNALDEAVGRATEMGKPVLYVSGLADVNDIQTLASLSILGHVARKTAEYETPILVPTSRAVVMSTAQEVVKEAYTAAGRPDAYSAENVMYISDDQFGWAAGIDGIMLREKPAANFYMGCFYAESLILAETGNATGAIQIAGTAMPAQLPFFVAACDYTLIGEELYAASAYLSNDPLQVGSLRGQDVGKAIVMACLFLGPILLSLGFHFVKDLFIS